MRASILGFIGLTPQFLPVNAQPLTTGECDEFVIAITGTSRAAAGMLIHIENMNITRLKVAAPVQRLEDARRVLVAALSEFTLAAKEVGQAVPAELCPL